MKKVIVISAMLAMFSMISCKESSTIVTDAEVIATETEIVSDAEVVVDAEVIVNEMDIIVTSVKMK